MKQLLCLTAQQVHFEIWNIIFIGHISNFSLSIISLGLCVWLCVSDLLMPTTSWIFTSRTIPTVWTGVQMRLAVISQLMLNTGITGLWLPTYLQFYQGWEVTVNISSISSATVLFPASHCPNPEIRPSFKLQIIAWIKPYISPQEGETQGTDKN